MVLFKSCSKCKEELPYYCFNLNIKSHDGLSGYCKECHGGVSKLRYVKLRYKLLEQANNYNATHRDDVRATQRRYRSHPQNRMIKNIKNRFKDHSKKKQHQHLKLKSNFGCSYKELRSHIKNQWTSEMNWENYGKLWEIDHIQSFHLLENKALFNHYMNLQPMLKTEHQKKSKLELKTIRTHKINSSSTSGLNRIYSS